MSINRSSLFNKIANQLIPKRTMPSATVLLMALFFIFYSQNVKGQDTSWTSIVTSSVKLDTAHAFSVYVCDINNDYYPDIVVVKDWNVNTANSLRLYFNVQDTASSDPNARMFVDGTPGSGINSMPNANDTSKGTIAVAFADINNDGNLDMVRGSFYYADPNSAPQVSPEVFLGDGMGHFNIVPNNGLHELGLTNVMGFSFLDYDKDGKIDLFIARWFYDYQADQWQTGLLMKGNGDGTFTNTTADAGITIKEPMYGCGVVDWNNDGWPDIATDPYCRTGGQLWRNNGDGTFTDVASSVGYNAQVLQGDNGQNLCMWNAAPEDFDNDGDMDFIFCLVHGGNDANEGHSTIVVNKGPSSGFQLEWAMDRMTWKAPRSYHHGDYDASWFDLDNDGLEDIVLAQGHYVPATDRLYVFQQQQDHTFMDITQDLGLITQATKDMHYAKAIDYDLDGDDDILVSKATQPSEMAFIENKKGQDNNWLGIRLNAPAGVNKSSIGARIYVWAGGVSRMREVYAGRGNGAGQQPFNLLFGLGTNTSVDSVKVMWPDLDRHYTIVHPPEINKYIEIGPQVNGSAVGIASVLTEAQPNLKLYPNPTAHDYVLLQLSNNVVINHIEVYDNLGKKVLTRTFNNPAATQYCSLEALPPGHYTITVRDRNNQIYHASLIKL